MKGIKKFIQQEFHGKINIIEVIEIKETMTRNIQRWICEVTPQETKGQTVILAYEIINALEKAKK